MSTAVSVTDSPPHQLRRRIGYVFQGIGLFPHLTVAENIGITPRLLGLAAPMHIAPAPTSCSSSSICRSTIAQRFPAELSGGQRSASASRVRSLRGRSIMLMDEPFGALDPRDARRARHASTAACTEQWVSPR